MLVPFISTFISSQIHLAFAASPSASAVVSSSSNLLGATSLSDWVTKFVTWATTIGISVAALMILYAGVEYINSGGNETKIKGAKDRVIGTLLGIIILLLIGTIMRVLLKTS
ncbi:MAG: hypothetical protein WC773_04090 [Patescibacteria group bacterium]